VIHMGTHVNEFTTRSILAVEGPCKERLGEILSRTKRYCAGEFWL
jgi:hypothetical protein